MRTRSRLAVPLLLTASFLGSALLAGCTAARQADPAASGASTSTSGAPASGRTSGGTVAGTDAVTSAPPFHADVRPDASAASADAQVTVSAIRIGAHDGFDRVVFELGGKGTPGWDVRYVDRAESQGSGKPVAVAGDAVLQVWVTGSGYPYDTGVKEYSGPRPLATAGTQAVTQVVFDGTFEGTTEAFIGTAAKTPFRVYALSNPTRIVVEVADKG
ncbi:MAG: AMIN-like domain-containing (lipo)protein [Blastococcus sp.]